MQSTPSINFLGINFADIPEKCRTLGAQGIDSTAKIFDQMNESFKTTEMGQKINRVVSPVKVAGGLLATYAIWNIFPLFGQALLIATTASLAMKLLFNKNVLTLCSSKQAEMTQDKNLLDSNSPHTEQPSPNTPTHANNKEPLPTHN